MKYYEYIIMVKILNWGFIDNKSAKQSELSFLFVKNTDGKATVVDRIAVSHDQNT